MRFVIAILARDPDGAAAAMRAHIAGSSALLHGFLDKLSGASRAGGCGY
jgi:DNA-binding FadR family transcriptional regulator